METFKKLAKKFNGKFILIDPETSEIQLRIQDGPIQEVGMNGTQIDMLGEIWVECLRSFNKDFPCRENSITITKIDEALLWQLKRKLDREKRGVEGYNKS
jgi:hypothetical protein